MLKLHKNNALAIGQLADKAKKKIPLYETKGATVVRVPFHDFTTKKERFLEFYWRDHDWGFCGVVD
jgi:hypothetical protein